MTYTSKSSTPSCYYVWYRTRAWFPRRLSSGKLTWLTQIHICKRETDGATWGGTGGGVVTKILSAEEYIVERLKGNI